MTRRGKDKVCKTVADKTVAGKTGKRAAVTDELSTLAEIAGEMVEAGQAAAMGVFEAEVDELKAISRGTGGEDAATHEARLREEDDEAEEGFDNMPV